ncbi:MAG: fructosamine kinase family protein [Spirochaetes bacterium]|nr:fructosamine kinase family protein [Spirochaetota bacterium]
MHNIRPAVKDIFGQSAEVKSITSVSGGSISESFLAEINDGKSLFIKKNNLIPEGLFKCESNGLSALKSFGARVPEVYKVFTAEGYQYIIMQYIERTSPSKSSVYNFGRELAELHRKDAGDKYGFSENNYIGANRQLNNYSTSWVSFFAEMRLGYQLKLAVNKKYFDDHEADVFSKLIDKLGDIIPEDKPSLIHGDLWGGNYINSAEGCYLIDPAVYFGSREADIAMTELFGGFSNEFYRGYDDVYPLDKGYRERRDLYNLYHILNHLNLFGLSYKNQALSIAKRYVR